MFKAPLWLKAINFKNNKQVAKSGHHDIGSDTKYFKFEALPKELQIHILSFTDLVTELPAQDLLPDMNTTKFGRMAPCCLRCRPRRSSASTVCECFPPLRQKETACRCLVFSQPLLAVNRNVRSLSLDYIYRHATFMISPTARANLARLKNMVEAVEMQRLAKVRRLDIMVNVEDAGAAVAPSSEEVWINVLELLRQKCTRHDARIKLVLISARPSREVDRTLYLVEELALEVGLHNVEIEWQPMPGKLCLEVVLPGRESSGSQ